jgi:hypothetical protein
MVFPFQAFSGCYRQPQKGGSAARDRINARPPDSVSAAPLCRMIFLEIDCYAPMNSLMNSIATGCQSSCAGLTCREKHRRPLLQFAGSSAAGYAECHAEGHARRAPAHCSRAFEFIGFRSSLNNGAGV